MTDSDRVIVNGVILYRIQALRSFGDVKKGEVGGFIEKEANLAHEGEAWIYDNARVYENAQVYGKARVYDSAQIYGKAEIHEHGRVFDHAQVYEDGWVFFRGRVHGNAKICGRAWISSGAEIFGNAKIYGNANIGGYTEIYGDAEVFGDINTGNGDPHILADASISNSSDVLWFSSSNKNYDNNLTAFKSKNGTAKVNIGYWQENIERKEVEYCLFEGTVEEFLARSKIFDDEKTFREFSLLIDVILSKMNLKK